MTKIEMAVIGMGFHVGEFNSVEDFMKGLVVSKKAFKLGLNNDSGLIHDKNILIEKTITEAIQDSGLSENEKKATAFIWHCASSPKEKLFSTDGQAAEVAAHFGFGGLSYTVYDGENSIFRGLALAQYLIGEKRASVVVICVTPPIIKQLEEKNCNNAEGSVVLVLKDKNQAMLDKNKIYASIDALTIIDDMQKNEKPSYIEYSISEEFVAVLNAAGVTNNELRVVEIPGLGCNEYYELIDRVCNESVEDYLTNDSFIIADTESFMGDKLAISTAVSFVKHALQLFFYHVFTYDSESSEGVSFFVDRDPSLWNTHPGRRSTAIFSITDNIQNTEYIGIAVLTDCIDKMEEDSKCRCKEGLLPIACEGPDELFEKLLALKQAALERNHTDESMALRNICGEAWTVYRAIESPQYTAVLMFDTLDALCNEIDLLLAKREEFTIKQDFCLNFRYTSKRGSYFTPQPYGKEAKVVFMNPPGSAQHMLLFYEMLTIFPRFRNFYATIMNSTFAHKMNEMDYRFGRFAMEMWMIGIVDRIARNRLGLSADILTGASLGEIATLFAYDCLEFDMYSLDSTALMNLFSAFKDTYVDVPYQLSVKYIKANIEEIHEAASKEENIHVLVSASPFGAFVSGKPEPMEHFVEKNRFIAWPLDLSSSIHTPYVEKYYDVIYQAMLELDNKLRDNLDVEIYSTYYKKPIENSIESIAEFTAAILIKPCDFYGLLEVLYDKGSRIFIDMSTGGTCLAWAQETFASRDTFCFSVYPSFLDSRGSLLKTFAKLLSNHANINIDTFLNSFEFSFMPEITPISFDASVDFDILTTEIISWSMDSGVITEGYSAVAADVNVTEPGKAAVSAHFEILSVNEFVNRNSLSAYRLYLENEKSLLDKIRNPFKTIIKKQTPKPCIWDYDDIIEITNGAPSKVWGEKYAALDRLKRRARLPLPPFMFVDRVIEIDAEFGNFRPSSINVEYKITDDCIFRLSDNKISILLLTEASHIAILLLAYIGIDMLYEGNVSYRILDSSSTVLSDFPIKGDVICSRLEFVEFIKSGRMTLVKSRHTIHHANGKPLLVQDLMGGFFAEEDLNRSGIGLLPFKPNPDLFIGRAALTRMNPRTELLIDTKKFYDGDYDVYFYKNKVSMDVEKLCINPLARMIDRVISIDFDGGDYGLGYIIGEKDITEDHWSFKVHFKNDPVFPGSLLVEAANHQQMIYVLNAGYAIPGNNYVLSFEQETPIKSIFRGQVKPIKSVIRFVQHIKKITETPKGVIMLSNCDVYWQNNIVARVENLSVILEER